MQDRTPTRCAVYIRVSDPKQEREGASLEVQEEQCRAYAAEHGHVVVDLYREILTGTLMDERPELSRMREAIIRREYDRVVVWRLDRLGRDPDHRVYLRVEWQRHGVSVESVTDPTEQSREGHLIDYISGYAAWLERESIVRRTQEGRRKRATSGKLLPARRPFYGYAWRDEGKGAYDVDPTTAPVVRRIYRETLAGASLRRIAKGLEADGIPTPTGGTRWSVGTLYHVLVNPAYCGEARALRWRSQRVGAKGYRAELRAETEQVMLPPGTVPALVNTADFLAAQERLLRNRERAARNNRQPEAALLRAGFIRCGHCGHRLVTTRRAYGVVYRGSGRVADLGCRCGEMNADLLDAAVWERVAGILTDPAVVARELDRLHADDPTEDDLKGADRAIAAVEKQQANLARRFGLVEDDDAATPLAAELNRLAAQKRALLAERDGVLRQQETRRAAKERLAHVEAWCRKVAANLGDLTYPQRRTALEALGVDVELYRADHTPRWRITAALPMEDPCAPPIAFTTTNHSGGGDRSGPHRHPAPCSTSSSTAP